MCKRTKSNNPPIRPILWKRGYKISGACILTPRGYINRYDWCPECKERASNCKHNWK